MIDLYPNIKFIFRNYDAGKKLDMINYPIYLIYTIYEIKKFKNFYFDSKFKIRLDFLLFILHMIIIPLMIIFDYNFPKHFINQTYNLKILVRSIYLLMSVYIMLSFKKYYTKDNQLTFINSLIKFPFIMYFFFISDEAERIYMFIIILPFFYFFSYHYKSCDTILTKMLMSTCLIILPDIIYTLNKGSYSFDVSLKVCVKSIGDYPDQTPIFTGFLMGTHKLRLFILSAAFLIEITENLNFGIDKNYFNLLLISDIQLNAIIISYFYYLYQDYEQLYLNIFLWAGTKSITILFVDIAILVNYCRIKGRIIKTDVIDEDELKLV